MTEIPLRLGPLAASGFDVGRSGIKWLRHTGSICKRGDVLAFCNIGLQATRPSLKNPFHEEQRDFQVAFTAPIGGRLRITTPRADGGWLDQLAFKRWAADEVLCFIEATDLEADGSEAPDQVCLLMLSGRRMFEVAEVRAGPLSGWHDRSRAWSAEADPHALGTLLGVGICDLTEVLRGPSQLFAELVQAAPGGAHVVRMLDEPLVPCARVLTEQLQRTPEQMEEIAEDIARTLFDSDRPPSSSDLLFIGALLGGLQRRTLTDRYPILARTGLSQSRTPDAIIMSMSGESSPLVRHRRLGYSFSFHGYRIGEAGAWLRRWVVKNFEPARRSMDDVKADFGSLMNCLEPNASVLVLNAVTDAPGEDIQNYQGLGDPLSKSVSSVRAKEMNLVLHDLAREYGVGLIDVDAIASDLGQRRHTIDPMHHSGAVQAEIRAEIVWELAARNVPGFRPQPGHVSSKSTGHTSALSVS